MVKLLVEVFDRHFVEMCECDRARLAVVVHHLVDVRLGHRPHLFGGVFASVVIGIHSEALVPSVFHPDVVVLPEHEVDPAILDTRHVPDDPLDEVGVERRLIPQFVFGQSI